MKKLNANYLLLMLVVLATSCSYAQETTVIDKTYPVQSFSSIDYDAAGKVIFTQSEKTSVRAEGDKRMIDRLDVSVSNGILKINQKTKRNLRSNKYLTIYISSPTIEVIDVDGVGNWVLQGKVKSKNLKIDFGGVGNFEALDLESENINTIYEGVGNLTLGGTAQFVKIKSKGVGNLNSEELTATNVVVISSGVGNVKLYASESIDINNEGVGNVTYYGNPETKKINRSGIGKVNQGD